MCVVAPVTMEVDSLSCFEIILVKAAHLLGLPQRQIDFAVMKSHGVVLSRTKWIVLFSLRTRFDPHIKKKL